jgi:hypothetical protein
MLAAHTGGPGTAATGEEEEKMRHMAAASGGAKAKWRRRFTGWRRVRVP